VTSIADPARPLKAVAVLRGILLLGSLALSALVTPWPWAALWLAVPAVVAASLLLAWRYGPRAMALPIVLAAGSALLIAFPVAGVHTWHLLWLPAAAWTGAWMGTREEGGGPALGDRAWMHVPILAAAFLLPLLPGMSEALTRVEARARVEEQQLLATLPGPSKPGTVRQMMEDSAKLPPADRVRMLNFFSPNLVFAWLVVLVAAGRALAARLAAWRGWPALSAAPLTTWRLPDAALAPLIGGLAIALFAAPQWWPGAALLLAQSALGYSVQGLAVAHSVLLARGVAPAFIMLLMVFLFVFTLPVFLPSAALLGLSDVWLDYRHIESSPKREA
jgi:hypothetical protein